MKKQFFLGAAFALSLSAGNASASGIPVFDAANAANFVNQLIELEKQLEQAKEEYEAVTGNRGMADIFNNPELRQYLPPDMNTIYDVAGNTGYGNIQSLIDAVIDEYELPDDIDAAEQQVRERTAGTGATNRALAEQAYEGTVQRMAQVDSLREEIANTDDPKAIAELQARIASEQSAIAVEQSRIQLMRMNAEAERELNRQQLRELNRRILSSDNTSMPSID